MLVGGCALDVVARRWWLRRLVDDEGLVGAMKVARSIGICWMLMVVQRTAVKYHRFSNRFLAIEWRHTSTLPGRFFLTRHFQLRTWMYLKVGTCSTWRLSENVLAGRRPRSMPPSYAAHIHALPSPNNVQDTPARYIVAMFNSQKISDWHVSCVSCAHFPDQAVSRFSASLPLARSQ